MTFNINTFVLFEFVETFWKYELGGETTLGCIAWEKNLLSIKIKLLVWELYLITDFENMASIIHSLPSFWNNDYANFRIIFFPFHIFLVILSILLFLQLILDTSYGLSCSSSIFSLALLK